jgi:eukaryotic-like serine/threonine-protein kinase
MIGQTLGHYHVIEEVGAGGMGVVYRAHDTRLDRDVALKLIRAGALCNSTARERFRKEALLLSKLCHPNIAQVYDFDSQDDVDFLIMEYVVGTTLASTIASEPIPEETSINIGIQIASALEHAAEAGIVHRDLKPSNTMITLKGNVKVLDFGLARLFRSDENITESIDTGGVVGTLPYMSPEQLRGEPADFRSDIYSLGAILYQAGTGQRPFESRNSTTLISDILNKSPVPLRTLNPRLSPGFEDIVLRCLAKEPRQRLQRASELRVGLETLRGSGTLLPSTMANPRFHSPRILAVAALIIVVSWFGILATWRSSKRVPKIDAAIYQ